MKQAVLIICAGAHNAEMIHAIAAEITAGDTMPDNLQWMPPGEHVINASAGGKPARHKVKVDAAQAERVQRDFLAIKAKSDAGEEDRPYFDLNHDDREASAHPTEYYWGGDDPVAGGIRAKVEWSGTGERAVKGKDYRRFSPGFFINKAGEISLVHQPSGEMAVNQGGLVNRAAFKRIQPLWSKSASADVDPANEEKPTEENQNNIMKSLLAVLAKLGLTTSAEVDEATAVTQVTAKFGEVSNAKTNAETELTQTKAKLTDTEAKLTTAKKAHATSVVDAAITAGRIPGQNEELKAKWIGLIEADPTNASMLPEPSEALKRIVAKEGKGAAETQASANGEHPFLTQAREYASTHKTSEAFAADALAHKNPKLYDEYRASLNLGIPVGSRQ